MLKLCAIFAGCLSYQRLRFSATKLRLLFGSTKIFLSQPSFFTTFVVIFSKSMDVNEIFPLDTTLQRVAQLIEQGDAPSAARFSGEALAMYDDALRRAINTDCQASVADAFVRVATAHIDALRAINLSREAFECAIMALITADIAHFTDPAQANAPLLPLSVHTALSLMEVVDTLQPTPDNQLNASMALSLIGYLLQRFGAANASDGSASLLPILLGAAPGITVDGQQPADATTKALLSEIVALAARLGLLSQA